jgi:2-methylcitrate dehydratase PrpD
MVTAMCPKKETKATKTLVDYITRAKFADFPKKVVERAKTCLMDSVGCALGGYNTQLSRVVFGVVKEMSGKDESTLYGDGAKVPCANAAFANAVATNALDIDDTAFGHPGATIIPAALAVGESIGCSGKDLLTAIICGYEVEARITAAIQPSPERFLMVWGIGTPQIFGATAAAAKLLRLDSPSMASAFGIAGTFAPVPSERDCWSWTKRPLHWVKDDVAFPAYGGVLSTLLAKRSFIGSRNILDGDKSFYIMAGSDRCDYDRMTRGLGEIYDILNVSFKPYASCKRTHPCLDAIKSIVETYSLKPENIENVNVKMFAPIQNEFTDYSPMNIVDAEFSLPYVAAMVILGEKAGPNWFTEDKLRSSRVLSLAKKVEVNDQDEEAKKALLYNGKTIGKVTITTKDGRTFKERRNFARGDPERPLTEAEFREKFIHLASFVLSQSRIEKLIETINEIEKTKDIRQFTQLLH